MIDELTIRRVKDAANVYDVIGDFFHLVLMTAKAGFRNQKITAQQQTSTPGEPGATALHPNG